MSQGKAWEKDEVIEILKEFFKLGCSVKKACEYAGIPYTTVTTWIQNDETLRLQITAWQNEMSVLARKNWRRALGKRQGGYTASVDWLSKKEKNEFADRKELTGANGENLFDEEHKSKADKAIADLFKGDTGGAESAGD